MLLALRGVEEGRSYGMPAFELGGKFFARFRDNDTVLVLRVAIPERDILMQMDPAAFFFTEHYRNYPAVLIRLAEIPPQLLELVLEDAHLAVARPAVKLTASRKVRPARR